jgi:hypothetical protein
MGLSVSYTLNCDLCGTDVGASRPTQDEIWDYAWRGDDCYINRHYGAFVCGDCFDPNMIYHAQYRNVFCVLCQSGEHIALIK